MKIDMEKYQQLRRKAKRYISVMDSLIVPINEREAAKIAYFGIIAEIVAMWGKEEEKVNV
jgi:hypothetical protein